MSSSLMGCLCSTALTSPAFFGFMRKAFNAMFASLNAGSLWTFMGRFNSTSLRCIAERKPSKLDAQSRTSLQLSSDGIRRMHVAECKLGRLP